MTGLIILATILLIVLWFKDKGVPVLLFHQVNETSNTKPEALEGYFKYLSEQGYHTFTLAEADAIFKTKKRLPKKSMLLTFDDGYYDNYSIVFPLLKKYNLKAIFFVNTLFIKERADRTDTSYESSDRVNSGLIKKYFQQEDATSDQYFTWEEMREMEASGFVDIQCHSHRHGMVFSNTDVKNVIHIASVSSGDYFVHEGNLKEGYPLFKMRGELTLAGLSLKKEGKEQFKKFYEGLESLSVSTKEKKRRASEFVIKSLTEYVQPYSESEYKDRVVKELSENIQQIESHLLHKKAIGFAWPYGHQTTVSIPWIQSLGVKYFFTCKKGTNASVFNPSFIYRMELRTNTSQRLIWLTKINSNLALGWLYRWIS